MLTPQTLWSLVYTQWHLHTPTPDVISLWCTKPTAQTIRYQIKNQSTLTSSVTVVHPSRPHWGWGYCPGVPPLCPEVGPWSVDDWLGPLITSAAWWVRVGTTNSGQLCLIKSIHTCNAKIEWHISPTNCWKLNTTDLYCCVWETSISPSPHSRTKLPTSSSSILAEVNPLSDPSSPSTADAKVKRYCNQLKKCFKSEYLCTLSTKHRLSLCVNGASVKLAKCNI